MAGKNRERKLVIGVNSGTSLDALDICLFEISRMGAGYRTRSVLWRKFSYPAKLGENLRTLASDGNCTITSLAIIDKEFSLFLALKIKTFLRSEHINKSHITLIGSHGQTVLHLPENKMTLQIGDPAIIATVTGITTIGDFRRADIGAGGQGAPLSPVAHKHLFGGIKPVAALNIGGIANVSYIPSSGSRLKVSGFDCGPGNIIIDYLSNKYFGRNFDRNGRIARSGIVLQDVMENLSADPFINASPPKSTGREYYNKKYIERYFNSRRKKEDLICTATEFSAMAIALNIRKFLKPTDKIIACGGGALNNFMLERLRFHLPDRLIITSDKEGLHPKTVECAIFAILGLMAENGIKSDLTGVTGANFPAVLGKVCYA